ncbi:MAG: PD-(D/E)XK nuclease family protein [Ilumatobacter sp.]|uniref:PD-(D/E)XK nuclease family protein n=1 Tax=Ilumatobacter sp. TaxID=1967498 RepID=UPI002603EC38|nr:PD-(D/E)XK nuclease family protein [Ilumatobacter sp.]MDJ0768254.1 PD-(D/E)XK nuclease family protein [Ilumatobacter sp.]
MTIRATPVRPAAALAELARAVRDAKAGDPLAPVSVVVPTNATGVTARRWLGRHGGVAAVDMLTLHRLAELLAGPSLAAEERRPVSTPVIDIAVRSVLRATPGAFAAVADHPSTVVALRDLHRELRVALPDAPDRLAIASGRGREAAEVSTRVTDLLTGEWYDEGDLLRRSIERTEAAPGPPQLERIVVFLPHPLRGLETALLQALGDAGHVEALLAHTGDAAADDEVIALGLALDPSYRPRGVEPIDTRGAEVVSATDADEEVRHAVRAIVDAARRGTPLDRIAVLWPADRPYARLAEHHLDAAGVPWNGRPGTGVAERVVPRFLLDLCDVDRRGLGRRELFDLLADLPVRDRAGHHVPTARWERISRRAGVARDDDWGPRLRRYAGRERDRAPDAAADRADDAEALLAFVDDLRRTLGPRNATRPWADWVDWAERQIAYRLGKSFADERHVRRDIAERQAWDHTNRVLDRLRSLDAISGPVRRSEFRAAFAAEFDVAPGRLGRIGTGVTIGSLSGAAGLDVDLAIVLGAADGLMPPAPSSGPLIGEADRAAAGLAPATAAGSRIHRQFRAVLDGVPNAIVLYPRGDLRATTERHPSRWIASTLGDAELHHQSSHHAALLACGFPASRHEHRLRGRLAAATFGGPIDERTPGADSDHVLRRALAMRAARRSDAITVYDGDLSALDIAHFDHPVAPTQIEQWVACPHGYFARYLLGVRPIDEPADETQITANERGNLVHRTLDLFHRDVIDGALPQPSPGWTPAHLERLALLFEQVAAEFEAAGRTGRAASWHVERLGLWAELVEWFRRDTALLAARPARVISSEQRFGDDGTVTLPLAGGGRLAVRGDIDRVDRTERGELVVVDHKTGSARTYAGIADDDPTAGGTRFQLPVYAAGARAIAGAELPVRAEYSFFAREKYKRIGYALDDEVWASVAHDLGEAVAGIESGLFPNRPDVPGFQLFVSCHYCQPDALGTSERWPEWERKRHDPRGARWFADDDEHDDGADDGGGDRGRVGSAGGSA